MRNHVVETITKLAETDSRIMFITADLGFHVVEQFQQQFPNRFVNVGIAEQNMTAVAAGLALEGNIVFTYSIGNFATLRCIEQIRNDVCYHNVNVKILAVGGGFAYGSLGMTHHATEDIAMMRSLPNMRVYVPADADEAIACLIDAYQYNGPAYIRMARGGEPPLHETKIREINHLLPMTAPGKEINIIASGTILSEGIRLQKQFEKKGISAGVFSAPSIKPFDRKTVQQLAQNCKYLITIEEHNVIGGLGGACAETMAEMEGERARLFRFGLQDTYTAQVGEQLYLRNYYGMSAEKIYHYFTEKGIIECEL